MRFVHNEGITDPTINLAIEEYILTYLSAEEEPYLLFYINEPSIIIGKNQNTIEEINAPYVEEHGIHVVRRLSGGGAVYHDLGNLNYSFITKNDPAVFNNYKTFTEPVIRALQGLGVPAELTGRNDIQAGSRKISGNAQFASRGRMFSHGTLLFDSNMDEVVNALRVNPMKIESKGVKSVRSRVANITEFLDGPMTIEAFKQAIIDAIYAGQPVREYKLSAADWERIRQISEERYRSWDWNYGRSPRCNMTRTQRFEGVGIIDARLQIEEGAMQEVTFFGDFFGAGDVQELAELLTGVPYRRDAIEAALADVDLKRYFGNLEQEAFVSLLVLV